ncbi:PilX N-terminal domain-containing pilus assembly protein [Aquincola sp. MAHUQ-54]|uniref:PilX N-terminal domain-containing pilus assembly protein n=1 Tax=Aquincola agrisoli TaxID=3119538 RepID=A0AAW9Q6A4_9BURK
MLSIRQHGFDFFHSVAACAGRALPAAALRGPDPSASPSAATRVLRRTRPRAAGAYPPSRQQGVTLIVVLVLLLVTLLGGLSMARMSEVGSLVAGNVAFKERALQASEVGVNTAFAAVLALANDNGDQGGWYSATLRAPNEDGVPAVDWDRMPLVQVGSRGEFQVRYFVDRQCTAAIVSDVMRQCLLRESASKGAVSANNDGTDALDPAAGQQFRITVRVTGPGGSTTFVQSLVTKGATGPV